MFDLKIANGLIMDGSGEKAYRGDIGIVGDKIAAIGNLADYESKETIDAAGKIVSPGFIDMHTHSDFSFVYDAKANSHLYNGVTTDVISTAALALLRLQTKRRTPSLRIWERALLDLFLLS